MRDRLVQDLKNIEDSMLQLLGKVSNLTGTPFVARHGDEDRWAPRCDVYATADRFIVVIDLAGLSKEDIHLATSSDFIIVSGERKICQPDCEIYFYSLEIESGSFERRIPFPNEAIDRDNPEVTYNNGILKLEFPLLITKQRVIEIK